MQHLIPVNWSKLHSRELYDASLECSTNLASLTALGPLHINDPDRIQELALLMLTTIQGCSCGYVIPPTGKMMQVSNSLEVYRLDTFKKFLGGWCQPGPRNDGTPWNHRHRLVIREQESVQGEPINPLASLIAGTLTRGKACFVPINQIARSLNMAPRWISTKPINLELPFAEASPPLLQPAGT